MTTVQSRVRFLLLALLLVAGGLQGCLSPSERFDAGARRVGLTRTVVQGEPFDHTVYWNSAARAMKARGGDNKVLHVYFDGDGKPWQTKGLQPDPTARNPVAMRQQQGGPSADPTAAPHNPPILQLMDIDTQPAVFLGRPCFNGQAKSAGCSYPLWNDARYSEPVVQSLTVALERVAREAGAQRVVLFGQSGGGALAVLIADRVNFVEGIVTVSANLDTKAWLAYHAYPGMKESLNPAVDGRRHAAEHKDVFERHYSGGRDTVVPTDTVKRGLRSEAELIVYPTYDHNCCWADVWPQVLAEVDSLTSRPPAVASVGP